MNLGWMPLPTSLNRYCDPASLVLLINHYNHDFFLERESATVADGVGKVGKACFHRFILSTYGQTDAKTDGQSIL